MMTLTKKMKHSLSDSYCEANKKNKSVPSLDKCKGFDSTMTRDLLKEFVHSSL